MATIVLDTKTLSPRSTAVGRKASRDNQYHYLVYGDSSVLSTPTVRKLQQDAHQPQRSRAGSSEEDATLLSSSYDSDFGDLEDSRSDSSVPPIKAFSSTSRPRGIHPSDKPGLNKDKTSIAELGPQPDHGVAQRSIAELIALKPPQTYRPQLGLQIPYLQAVTHPSSVSPGPFQVQQSQPVFTTGTTSSADGMPALEDHPHSKAAKEIPRALSPTAEPHGVPTRGYQPQLPPPASSLQQANGRDSTLCLGSATESEGGRNPEPLLVKPQSGQKSVASGIGARVSRNAASIDCDHEAEAEIVQPSIDFDDLQRPLRCATAEDNDESQLALSNKRKSSQDEEVDDGTRVRPPLCKTRRVSSPVQSTLRSEAAGQQVWSDDSTPTVRKRQASAPSQARPGRRRPVQPLSSGGSEAGYDTAPALVADFEEWMLPDTIFKRVTMDGRVTFQLQFSWDPCTKHSRGTRSSQPPQDTPAFDGSSSTKRGKSSRGSSRGARTPGKNPLPRKVADPRRSEEAAAGRRAMDNSPGGRRRIVAQTSHENSAQADSGHARPDYVENGEEFWNVECL